MDSFRSKIPTPKNRKFSQKVPLPSDGEPGKQPEADLSAAVTPSTVSKTRLSLLKPQRRSSNPPDQGHLDPLESGKLHARRHSIGVVASVRTGPYPGSFAPLVPSMSTARHVSPKSPKQTQLRAIALSPTALLSSRNKPSKSDQNQHQKKPHSVRETLSQKSTLSQLERSRTPSTKKAGQDAPRMLSKPHSPKPLFTVATGRSLAHSSLGYPGRSGLDETPPNVLDREEVAQEILEGLDQTIGPPMYRRHTTSADGSKGDDEDALNDDSPLQTPSLSSSVELPVPVITIQQDRSAASDTADSDDNTTDIRLATVDRLNPKRDSVARFEELSASLEILMTERTPVDLSGSITIPKHQPPAHGGLGLVYMGFLHDLRVAVKVLKMQKNRRTDASSEASNERRITREIHVWAALKHQNICEFLGYSTEFSDYPAMISTWCERGTASEYLESQHLPVDRRIRMAQDVSDGLSYLHQLKVIHGDLKPSNVLIDGDGVARLCDFGLVRLADWEGPSGMTTTTPYTGTARYKAPELHISSENRHPIASYEGDMYSLGCLMLEFVEGIYPFVRFRTNRDVSDAIVEGYSPALRSETTSALAGLTELFWNLLEACWNEPASRPIVSDVVDALDYFARSTIIGPPSLE